MKRESLFIQATGQPEIPLVAIKSNTFVHLEVGVKIVFNSELDKMDLHQAGRTFNFERGKLH